MYIPVKQKKTSHFGSNFWECNSKKIGRDVFFYSELEYDHWILIESNPRIKAFCEQPLKISGYIDNEYRESIFDMWLLWEDGKEEFVEVKYSRDIENLEKRKDRVSKQIRLQQNWCENNNYNYRIVTEKQIRVNPLFSNSRIILPYIHLGKRATTDLIYFRILKFLKSTEQVTIKAISNYFEEVQISELYNYIFSLYLDNKIMLNIEVAPINQYTEVFHKNE
ncbi:TnsA endonuclease N-terminal domain-containing protein [Bacillus sp. CHD6a]|uniref:TnsA endonuclease N-terminal domain-containing protein n=1 Tax=Bacillus sp. CHD6a TaxID=1643452 RepID=UPI000760DE42|nr:TnsA endonuclease N-terminal domain-containing protein [Bacillus sp. CHD6a]